MNLKFYLLVAGAVAAVAYLGYYTYEQRQIGADAALEKVDKQNEKLENLAKDSRSGLRECDSLDWLYDFSTGQCHKPQ